MIKTIALVLLAALGLFLAFAATRPDTFRDGLANLQTVAQKPAG